MPATWKEEYVSHLTFAHPVLKALDVRYTLTAHEGGDFTAVAETATGTELLRPGNGARWPSAETAEAAVEKHRGKILAGIAKALEEARS